MVGHLPERPWIGEAACLGLQDIMFGRSPSKAKAVCANCPVFTQCEALMLSNPVIYATPGVLAGKTLADRGIEGPCTACHGPIWRRKGEKSCRRYCDACRHRKVAV